VVAVASHAGGGVGAAGGVGGGGGWPRNGRKITEKSGKRRTAAGEQGSG